MYWFEKWKQEETILYPHTKLGRRHDMSAERILNDHLKLRNPLPYFTHAEPIKYFFLLPSIPFAFYLLASFIFHLSVLFFPHIRPSSLSFTPFLFPLSYAFRSSHFPCFPKPSLICTSYRLYPKSKQQQKIVHVLSYPTSGPLGLLGPWNELATYMLQFQFVNKTEQDSRPW